MRYRSHSLLQELTTRRGQMSTPALVFLILGIVFGILVVIGVILAALLLPAVQQAREAAYRTQSKNNLKQIGLAAHNYHDVYGLFPPGGTYTAEGDPYHSWMSSLLPYCDQSALYEQIDFNEPWTDQANQQVFTAVVPNYLNPALMNSDGSTAMANGLGAAHYAGNSQLLLDNGSTGIRRITDGTSNTFFAGEVSAGFMAWGDPANRRDPATGFGDTAAQFGSTHSNGSVVNMLLCDGSVRAISVNINPEVMKALASPAGGEQIGQY